LAQEKDSETIMIYLDFDSKDKANRTYCIECAIAFPLDIPTNAHAHAAQFRGKPINAHAHCERQPTNKETKRAMVGVFLSLSLIRYNLFRNTRNYFDLKRFLKNDSCFQNTKLGIWNGPFNYRNSSQKYFVINIAFEPTQRSILPAQASLCSINRIIAVDIFGAVFFSKALKSTNHMGHHLDPQILHFKEEIHSTEEPIYRPGYVQAELICLHEANLSNKQRLITN
jgi:hypothetical protein